MSTLSEAQEAWNEFASYNKKGIRFSPNQHAEWNFIEGYLQGARAIEAAVLERREPVALADPGRRLYAKWTDEQGIHCNRFPGWTELSQQERDEWNRKATPTLMEYGRACHGWQPKIVERFLIKPGGKNSPVTS